MNARNFIALLTTVLAFVLPPAAALAEEVPGLGRFLQRDPNATGQVVLNDATWFHGRAPVVAAPYVDIQTLYGDGANLYQYLGSNPLTRTDPMGLSWDPFDEAFAIGAEHLWSGLVGVNQALYVAKEGSKLARAYERAAFQWSELVWDRDTAILFSLIGGPFISTICFEEGTPVVLADGSMLAIESLPLGAAVFSTKDPHATALPYGSADPDAHDRIDPVTWRTVELTLEDAQRGTVRVTLLRPLEWFQATGLRAGSEFALDLPDMDISGTARVVAIGPCPEVEKPAPGGQIVTGTFVTERAEIVRVWLEGAAEPIGATPSHPFYSEDRSAWIPAGELREGESVRTLAGTAEVSRVEPVAEPTTVYNFEVHRSHTYYVGADQVWVHNPCFNAQRGVFNDRVMGATIRADYVRRGSTLEMFNVYAKGNVGMSGWMKIRDYVAAIARQEGFKRLIIEGVRDETGRIVRFVLDL